MSNGKTNQHKLIRLDGKELKKLNPGRRMDHIIAENVLRCGWHRTFESGCFGSDIIMHWCNSRFRFMWSAFKPSTNLEDALEAAECFVDAYTAMRLKGVRIELTKEARCCWTVKTLFCFGNELIEIVKVRRDNLPEAICLALIGTYRIFGPKDYMNGWIMKTDECECG